jgi:predicted PurR-regulated permease PerM
VYLSVFATVGITGYVLLPLLGAQVTEFGRQVPSYIAYARDQLQAWQHFIDPIIFLKASARPSIERLLARSIRRESL